MKRSANPIRFTLPRNEFVAVMWALESIIEEWPHMSEEEDAILAKLRDRLNRHDKVGKYRDN